MSDTKQFAESPDLTDAQYLRLANIVYEQAGISLGDSKKELLHARLGKLLRKRGISGFGEYLRILREDATGEELISLIDAVSTNVTDFFREENHFDFLAERITELTCPGNPRIWCAGCSSGEEAYSIAITLREYSPKPVLPLPCVLATDISTRMLEHAAAGVYPLSAVERLHPALVKKYFLKGKNTARGMIRVKKTLADLIVFQRSNLIEPLTHGQTFHFVFCRNVMIYFDNQTRRDVVRKFHQLLEPGGYLIIGHSESLNGISHPFRYIQPTIYTKE
ncbi:MAG: CheR family methyltransferase [Candidatus Latescibacterota bacterium]